MGYKLIFIRAVATALFVILVASACDGGSESELRIGEIERSNFMDFIDSVDTFPYSMPQERKEQFLRSLSSIEVGMHKDSVRQTLGEPDSESFTYHRGDEDAEPMNSIWAYYLYREEKELAGRGDLAVYIYFGRDDVIYEVISPE